MRIKCLAQKHNTMSLGHTGLEHGLLDPRPVCTLNHDTIMYNYVSNSAHLLTILSHSLYQPFFHVYLKSLSCYSLNITFIVLLSKKYLFKLIKKNDDKMYYNPLNIIIT